MARHFRLIFIKLLSGFCALINCLNFSSCQTEEFWVLPFLCPLKILITSPQICFCIKNRYIHLTEIRSTKTSFPAFLVASMLKFPA